MSPGLSAFRLLAGETIDSYLIKCIKYYRHFDDGVGKMLSRLRKLSVALGLVAFGSHAAFAVTPLDTGSWYQIARMSDHDLGMFDGNGAFYPTYMFGTFSSALQDSDFHRTFDVYDGMEILFITGDGQIWGSTLYSTLTSLISAQEGVLSSTNIMFNSSFGTVMGNVLSRALNSEDPWISLVGNHFAGLANQMIIWGEMNYYSPSHSALKNTHDGVNVYVSVQTTSVPGPVAGAGLPAAMALGSYLLWRRRKVRG